MLLQFYIDTMFTTRCCEYVHLLTWSVNLIIPEGVQHFVQTACKPLRVSRWLTLFIVRSCWVNTAVLCDSSEGNESWSSFPRHFQLRQGNSGPKMCQIGQEKTHTHTQNNQKDSFGVSPPSCSHTFPRSCQDFGS